MRSILAVPLIIAALPLSAGVVEAADFAKANKNGFQIIGIITADPDWLKKWQTSPETTPEFHGIGVLHPGVRANVLTFFSGAKTVNGRARLTCDVVITEQDGKKDRYPARPCFDGPLAQPSYIVLTNLDLQFEAAPADPSGTMKIDIGITDVNRGLRLPLHLSVMVDTSGNHA